MTLNIKMGVSWIFLRFWAARHISKANCAEINTNRLRQTAYEIFSIKRRFQGSGSRPSRFNETCVRKPQIAIFPSDIWPLLASLAWKRLQRGMDIMDMLPIAYHNKHYSDELFSRINIDNFKTPWTPQIRGFVFFAIFRCAAHFNSELRRNG